jgi:hypothetical protein
LGGIYNSNFFIYYFLFHFLPKKNSKIKKEHPEAKKYHYETLPLYEQLRKLHFRIGACGHAATSIQRLISPISTTTTNQQLTAENISLIEEIYDDGGEEVGKEREKVEVAAKKRKIEEMDK